MENQLDDSLGVNFQNDANDFIQVDNEVNKFLFKIILFSLILNNLILYFHSLD